MGTSDRLGVLVSDTKKAQFSEGFPGQGQIPPNEGKGDRYARTAFHSLEHPTNNWPTLAKCAIIILLFCT
jgi:hypothetical protein